MSNSDRTETVIDDAAASDNAALAAEPASRALVPMAFTERRARRRWYRWAPDTTFVAHLIAEAEQVPQARRARRASLADAQAAYRTRPAPTGDVGSRMRQVV
jgi:hypothetical protein